MFIYLTLKYGKYTAMHPQFRYYFVYLHKEIYRVVFITTKPKIHIPQYYAQNVIVIVYVGVRSRCHGRRLHAVCRPAYRQHRPGAHVHRPCHALWHGKARPRLCQHAQCRMGTNARESGRLHADARQRDRRRTEVWQHPSAALPRRTAAQGGSDGAKAYRRDDRPRVLFVPIPEPYQHRDNDRRALCILPHQLPAAGQTLHRRLVVSWQGHHSRQARGAAARGNACQHSVSDMRGRMVIGTGWMEQRRCIHRLFLPAYRQGFQCVAVGRADMQAGFCR